MKDDAIADTKYDVVLEEMLERYDDASAEWKDIRREGDIDMQYMAGDSFAADPEARKARKDMKRPIVDADELTQYVNQLLGKARQNKRGANVAAKGSGATPATAKFRKAKIRDIEYQSNAQQAYAVLLENAAQRSFGFLRIRAEYSSDDGFDQELRIDPVMNPNAVTPDPYDMRIDGRDMRFLFYEELRGKKEFEREFPGSRAVDFQGTLETRTASWIGGERIRLAEYWTKERAGRRVHLLLKPPPPTAENPRPEPFDIWLEEDAKLPSDDFILKKRVVDKMQVRRYLTNGIEILDVLDWPGPSIPFVSCYGKILYVDVDGTGAKRKILSLPRLARSLQMLYAYYRSQMAEMASMIPKAPVIGYRGQFAGVENDFAKVSYEPMAYLEANATTPETGSQILPLPVRLAYEAGAHLQALELCAEGARRAIQAAIGGSFLPTMAQKRNEKSGVALQQIEDTQDTGTFHFIDHFDASLLRTFEILNENIKFFYDTKRDTSIRNEKDQAESITINDPSQKEPVDTSLGEHDVTMSVGPQIESERKEASMFADSLLSSKEALTILGPELAKKVLAAAVRLKQAGPIGDDIAELLDPSEEDQQDPARLAQENQQLKAKLQEAGQMIQQGQQIVQQKQVEQQGKKEITAMQLESKERTAALDRESKERSDALDREVKLAVAELGAKVDRMGLMLEESKLAGARAHDVGMAAMQHGQALEQGQMGQVHALEQGEQAHGQAIEQGQQGHLQTLEQADQAAALAPQPEA